MLDSFSLHSGLKINFEKTEVIFLGNGHKSTKETVISLASNRNITAEKAIKILGLGVHFTYDQSLWRNIDFDEILKTLKERLNCWNWRNLTVLGLIQIIPREAPSRARFIISSSAKRACTTQASQGQRDFLLAINLSSLVGVRFDVIQSSDVKCIMGFQATDCNRRTKLWVLFMKTGFFTCEL